MSRIDQGRRVRIIYREDDGEGRPIITVDVSGGDDILPHEHRDDHRTALEELLGQKPGSLEGVTVEVRRKQGDHPHDHPHDHEHGHSHEEQAPEPTKAGA